MKLKKHISIVLASLILLFNLGLSFSVHYCKDKIAGISFYHQETEPCIEKTTSCCANVSSHHACCSNKQIKVEKNSDDVLVNTFSFQLDQVFLNADWSSNFNTFSGFTNSSNVFAFYCDANAPPLYKLHCQFIFYA